MRIAQVAPLYEAVPPRLYGGTERIVVISDGRPRPPRASGDAVRQRRVGHLGAAGGGATARAQARPRPPIRDRRASGDALRGQAARRRVRRHPCASQPLHPFPVLSAHVAAKTVTTPHGRLDYADLPGAYACWPYFPMISISMRQRQPLAQARWVGNVHHGLPLDLYPRRPQGSGDYLAFLGRMSRDKRPDRAIEIARRAGMKLRIAAKIEGEDDRLFPGHDKAAARGTDVEYHRRDRRGRQKVGSCQRRCAAFPDRLAGAVRTGRHRGDGFRRPVIAWRGRSDARDRRRGRDRLCRRIRSRRPSAAVARCGTTRPRPYPAGLRTPLLGGADGLATTRPIYALHADSRRDKELIETLAGPDRCRRGHIQ